MTAVKENVCRGCLMVSAVELLKVHHEIRKSLSNICGLNESNDSVLPNRLCKNCLRLLKQCQQFRRNCQKSSTVLKKLLEINQDGKFKIEELYSERRKQINETHSLVLTQILNIECLDQNDIFDTSSCQTSIFISNNQLNENNSNRKTMTDDVDPLFRYSSEIKDVECSSQLCPVNFCDFKDSPPPLVYFNGSKGSTNINIDLPIKNELKCIDEYKGFDSPASIDLKEKIINITNGIPVEGLLKKNNKKNKKSNLMFGTIKKFKAISKENTEANTNIKQNLCIRNYSFDESVVNVVKLDVQEQLRALESARNKVGYLEAPFKCKPCAKYFIHELSLQGHMKRHSESAGEFICRICTQRYTSLRNLQSHDLIHKERLECKQCLQVICGRTSMAKHIAHTHNGLFTKFECEVCGKVTASKHNHRRHMLTHNTSVAKKYKCPYCPKTFSLSSSRNDHATRAHSNGEKYFPCKICKHSFFNKTLLRMHAITHSDKKDFYCVECDMHFKRQATLDRHLKASKWHGSHSFLRFKCDQCEKRYDTPLRLKEHVDSSHLQIFNWTCDKCPSKFLSRGGLRVHRLKIHEGKVYPKNHICSVCSKAFISKNLLSRHARTHTGELPFGCDACDRLFRQKSTLETHIKLIHLKLKRPFRKYNKMADIKIFEQTLPDSDCQSDRW